MKNNSLNLVNTNLIYTLFLILLVTSPELALAEPPVDYFEGVLQILFTLFLLAPIFGIEIIIAIVLCLKKEFTVKSNVKIFIIQSIIIISFGALATCYFMLDDNGMYWQGRTKWQYRKISGILLFFTVFIFSHITILISMYYSKVIVSMKRIVKTLIVLLIIILCIGLLTSLYILASKNEKMAMFTIYTLLTLFGSSFILITMPIRQYLRFKKEKLAIEIQ